MGNKSSSMYTQKELTSASVGIVSGLYMDFGAHQAFKNRRISENQIQQCSKFYMIRHVSRNMFPSTGKGYLQRLLQLFAGLEQQEETIGKQTLVARSEIQAEREQGHITYHPYLGTVALEKPDRLRIRNNNDNNTIYLHFNQGLP